MAMSKTASCFPAQPRCVLGKHPAILPWPRASVEANRRQPFHDCLRSVQMSAARIAAGELRTE